MKAQWKQKPLDHVKDKRVADLEKANIRIAELEKKNEEFMRVEKFMRKNLLNAQKRIETANELQQKYEWLINSELMLPTPDGMKYFDNAEELDKYVGERTFISYRYAAALGRSMQATKNQLLAGLNSIFDEEYSKYSVEIEHGNTGSNS